MEIILEGLGKKYIKEWIFRGVNFPFQTGIPMAVIGPNGSGKSTLLKIISGWSFASEGICSYTNEKGVIGGDKIYSYIDFISPYTELIEELRLEEFLQFHTQFKPLDTITIPEFIQKLSFQNDTNKFIKHFSSGMKQRLKLGLGIYSTSPILLLDEPTSNLDESVKKWYNEEISKILSNKIVIVASNQPEEYTFAHECLNLEKFK